MKQTLPHHIDGSDEKNFNEGHGHTAQDVNFNQFDIGSSWQRVGHTNEESSHDEEYGHIHRYDSFKFLLL